MPEKQELKLSHSEGKPDAIGVDAVNQVLRPVGVRISQVPIPTGAHPILKESQQQAIPESQHPELISTFYLDREKLLEHILQNNQLSSPPAATCTASGPATSSYAC